MALYEMYGLDAIARDLFRDLNPTVRTRKTEQGVGYEFDFPGVTAEDIDITVNNGVMSVIAKNDQRHYEHSMTLPHTVDVNDVQANLENGVLRIVFKWSEAARPKKIEIGSSRDELASSDTS